MSYDALYTLNSDTLWTRRGEGLAAGEADDSAALFRAAKDGDASKIRILVENGADIDAIDNQGWTPLFWAIKNRHVKAAAELLTAGADVEVEARNGWTPAALATKTGSPLIIDLITRTAGLKNKR